LMRHRRPEPPTLPLSALLEKRSKSREEKKRSKSRGDGRRRKES
jgi:hypothetical protein